MIRRDKTSLAVFAGVTVALGLLTYIVSVQPVAAKHLLEGHKRIHAQCTGRIGLAQLDCRTHKSSSGCNHVGHSVVIPSNLRRVVLTLDN